MTTLNTKGMSSVREEVKVNQIWHHGPRDNFYQIMNYADCKCPDGQWRPAVTYIPVVREGNGSYSYKLNEFKLYVRLIEDFDDDWALIG